MNKDLRQINQDMLDMGLEGINDQILESVN
jgi:hypothetical protein